MKETNIIQYIEKIHWFFELCEKKYDNKNCPHHNYHMTIIKYNIECPTICKLMCAYSLNWLTEIKLAFGNFFSTKLKLNTKKSTQWENLTTEICRCETIKWSSFAALKMICWKVKRGGWGEKPMKSIVINLENPCVQPSINWIVAHDSIFIFN